MSGSEHIPPDLNEDDKLDFFIIERKKKKIIKEGWLLKRSFSHPPVWRKKFFSLSNFNLRYFTNEDKQEANECDIPLPLLRLKDKEETLPFKSNVLILNILSREYILKAEDEYAAQDWRDAIESVLNGGDYIISFMPPPPLFYMGTKKEIFFDSFLKEEKVNEVLDVNAQQEDNVIDIRGEENSKDNEEKEEGDEEIENDNESHENKLKEEIIEISEEEIDKMNEEINMKITENNLLLEHNLLSQQLVVQEQLELLKWTQERERLSKKRENEQPKNENVIVKKTEDKKGKTSIHKEKKISSFLVPIKYEVAAIERYATSLSDAGTNVVFEWLISQSQQVVIHEIHRSERLNLTIKMVEGDYVLFWTSTISFPVQNASSLPSSLSPPPPSSPPPFSPPPPSSPPPLLHDTSDAHPTTIPLPLSPPPMSPTTISLSSPRLPLLTSMKGKLKVLDINEIKIGYPFIDINVLESNSKAVINMAGLIGIRIEFINKDKDFMNRYFTSFLLMMVKEKKKCK